MTFQPRLSFVDIAPTLRGTFFFLLVLLTVLGCAEDPTSVGLGLLPAGDFPIFKVDTLTATGVATSQGIPLTYRQDPDVANWIPQHLFVGGVQSLIAGSFIRFSALPESLTGVTVTAADLILMPTFATGDSTLTPSFTLHRALTSWAGDSLTYDSLTSRPGVYFDAASLPPGVGTGTVDSGAVTFPLDTALVGQWFVTVVDSGTTNLGLFLRGSSNGVVQGYGSFLNQVAARLPRLRVAYVKNGVPGTIVWSTGTSRYLATLPSADLVLDPAKMYVQSGVSYRGTVTFDLSALPRPVSVSECILELTLDSASSRRTGGPDSLYAFYIEASNRVEKLSAIESERTTQAGNPVYAFKIPLYAQQWTKTGDVPRVVLAGLSENTNFDRLVFHGPTALPGLRPRLIITFSRALTTWGGRS